MDSNGFSDPFVKLDLLPVVDKATRLRTKTIYKTLNPVWNETVVYHGITIDDLKRKTIRLVVYDEDRVGQDFLGETRVPLRKLIAEPKRRFDVYLEKQAPVCMRRGTRTHGPRDRWTFVRPR